MCTTVHKISLESQLRFCTLVNTKILEVSILNVILDKKLNLICHYALHITLSKKVRKFRGLDRPETKSTAFLYSL